MKKYLFAFLALPAILLPSLGLHETSMAMTMQAATIISGATAPNSAVSADTSLNWGGYVSTGGTYTQVGATWAVPAATSSNSNLSADATWVGIGGVSNTDLIQAGTQTIFQNGAPRYQAWYELLPATSVQIPFAVHPGDLMTVGIVETSAGDWQISFNDATTGQNYETSVNYNSSLSSAEWIEEMPSDQQGFVPLDNFGTASFSNTFGVQNGSRENLSALDASPMTMITNGNQALATPSAIGTDGASFTVTRTSVVATETQTGIGIGRGRWSRAGRGAQGYTPMPTSSRTFRVIGSNGNGATGNGNGLTSLTTGGSNGSILSNNGTGSQFTIQGFPGFTVFFQTFGNRRLPSQRGGKAF